MTPSKTKSPPAPNFGLQRAFTETKKVYDQFSRASLSDEDLANALGHSTTNSGTFVKKRFTLIEFGLLEEVGDELRVAEAFLDLRDAEVGTPRFKKVAFPLARSPKVFATVLEGFDDRLPDASTLAGRLERQNFTRARAEEVAAVLRESLEYAGVLDSDNRLRRPGAVDAPSDATGPDQPPIDEIEDPADLSDVNYQEPAAASNLRLELMTIGGGKLVLSYPPKLSASDVARVSAVLQALVVDG